MTLKLKKEPHIRNNANANLPLALPFKMSLIRKRNMVNLKSASFVAITLSHEGLTHIWREFQ